MKVDGKNLSSLDPHLVAADLARLGRFDEAWKACNDLLTDDPLDARALVTASHVMMKMNAPVQGYHFARAATQLLPNDDACWTNMGHAASLLWLTDEAEICYRKALDVAKKEDRQKILWLNLSALYLDNGRFDEAEIITRKILEVDPNYRKALANLGFCQLANRQWSEGWKNYRYTIGSDWRPRVQYKDEPEWDGTKDKVVILYEDQGLGDAISFASMLPDAVNHCKKVILDCDERLAKLFQRSFPKVKVYGTRKSKDAKWEKRDWTFDASLPLGQIGEYYRTTPESFPGTPYLKPCSSRTSMWKGHFKAKDKPCIGIAWSGGIPKTNSRNRKLNLTQFLPLFHSIDAHWVCLQYKDAESELKAFREKHRIDIVQYPWATLTNDYDDTAALIASLDCVVCMQTAVAHTAGALGVPVTVLVPKATQWRYGEHGESIPWYQSLKVIRQETHGSWESEIERAGEHLRAYLSSVPQGAGETTRSWDLRGRFHHIRPDHLIDHHSNGGGALT